MDGEWAEVKAKKIVKKKKPEEKKMQYGGKGAGGKLIAGPIQQKNTIHSFGNDFEPLNNQASHMAGAGGATYDDYGDYGDE